MIFFVSKLFGALVRKCENLCTILPRIFACFVINRTNLILFIMFENIIVFYVYIFEICELEKL